ncbi:MAG TPA: nucleotide exchange factor GrpE [Xanthobacteraceae bacterium]|nr:nucleotide exchange factor GrpE [Xanthobacteraceae bacterium]
MTDIRASDLDPEEPNDMAEPEVLASAPEAADALSELARETADLKDRLLRSLAEMENLRRRTEREVADSRAYGISAFARDLLGVADNMRRALEAIGPAARETVDPGMRALIDGVELTERELLNVLEKHGVKKLDPQGKKFDPHRHQAMVEVPDPSVPAGTVVQVVQPGYTIGERVLRPALVAVAKGGPKSGPAEAAPASANDNSADPN